MGTTGRRHSHGRPAFARAVLFSLTGLLAVLATSCLHGDVDVTVKDDGSGEVVVEVFPSRNVQDELRERSIDIEDLVEGSFNGVDGVEFDEIEDGDRVGYRLVVPFDDYRDLQVVVDGGTLAGQQVQLFSSLTITELPDDAGWQLDAQILPLGQTIAGANAGVIPESMQDLIDSAGIGNAGSGLDLSVSLPGVVISSNASSIDGGTATWNLDEPEAPATLQMRTEPKEFPTTMQLVVGGAGLAVLLGLFLFVLGATRKHKSTKEPRRARTRRRPDKAKGQPDADWSAPVPGAAPTPESDRPEPLPPLATRTVPSAPGAAPAPAPAPDWAPAPPLVPGPAPEPAPVSAPEPEPEPELVSEPGWAPPEGDPAPVPPPEPESPPV